MKAGSVGFSFGFLLPEGGWQKRAGGKHIVQLGVFEITVTPAPMNNGTGVLATKALDDLAAIRDRAHREMFELLTAEPEPVTTKSVQMPVQIASFEC